MPTIETIIRQINEEILYGQMEKHRTEHTDLIIKPPRSPRMSFSQKSLCTLWQR